jgi:putative aldouronate transport system substrate-binding protein
MGNKSIRLCSLVMTAILLFLVFVGCAGREDTTGNGSKDTGTNQGSEKLAGDDPTDAPPEDAYTEHLVLQWMIPTQQNKPVNESKIVQEIIKRFNVEFEYIELPPMDQHPEKMKFLIASQDIPDIMTWVTKDDANTYGPQGAFLELTPYLETKLPNVKRLLDADPGGRYNAYTTEGKLWRIPDYNEVSLPIFDLSYIKAEFDAVGATKLDTWDDYYNALKLLKEKYPDSYPLSGRGREIGLPNVKSLFIISFTENKAHSYMCELPGFDYDKKEFIPSPAIDGFKDAIQYLSKLYDEGLLDPEYMTLDMGSLITRLKEKKAFSIMDFIGGLSGINDVQGQIDNGLYPLELPGVPGKNRVLGSQPIKIGDRGTIISAELANDKTKLDRVFAILDWLYSDEAYNLIYWHPDVTVEKDGQKFYIQEMYDKVGEYMDVYLPWSISASFRVNHETITQPGTPYADYKIKVFMDEANSSRWTPSVIVPFTAEQSERINKLSTGVADFYNANIDQFIVGQKSFAEWDTFVAELRAKGADEIAQIYNEAYNEYFAK